jgi:hypothetical protein
MNDKKFYDCVENDDWDEFYYYIWEKSVYNVRWLFNPYNPKFFDSIGVYIVDGSRIDGSVIIVIENDRQYNILKKYFKLKSLEDQLEDHIPKLYSKLTSNSMKKYYKIEGFKNENSRIILERKEKLKKLQNYE